MGNGMRRMCLAGLLVVLGLVFTGCTNYDSYRRENDLLKERVNALTVENEALKNDIQILQTQPRTAPVTVIEETPSRPEVDITDIVAHLKAKKLEVIVRDGNPAIIINDIFEPGEVTLTKKDKETVKKVAFVIMQESPNCTVRVDGYTDNQPIKKSKKYDTNKELSAARAKNVAEFLVKDCGFTETKVSSQGLGEEHPIASNKTEKGRDKNRRVELVLIVK